MRPIALLAIVILALAGGTVAACGDDGSGGTDGLDAPTVQSLLRDAGYKIQILDQNTRPASIGSFAVDPGSGFRTVFAVSGKGLKPPVQDFNDTVSVLVYDNGDRAQEAFDSLGGETANRKLVGNRIYMYGGGQVADTEPPELQQVIDVSKTR